MLTRFIPLCIIFVAFGIAGASCKNKALKKTEDPRLQDITLPTGFKISIFADNVENARSMAIGENGTLFVGNRQGDKVYALVDKDNDGVCDEKNTIANGMNMPNGVAFLNGALYIAEVDKIWRLDNIEASLANPPKPVLVSDKYPSDKTSWMEIHSFWTGW